MQRRLCGLLVLLGVCASVLPIPLPSSKPTDKDSSQPFPCQNRPCGCRSAEQCWKKCCCFTNSQKVAWAKTHRVNAPDYVHVAAAEESKAVICQKPCCAKKTVNKSCCQSVTDRSKGTMTNAAVQRPESREVDYVIGAFADECRGQSSFWNSLPWAVMPETLVLNICRRFDRCHAIPSCELPLISYQPPSPPPRRFSASAHVI